MVTLTDEDAESFERLRPGLKTLVLRPGYEKPRLEARTLTDSIPKRVVIVGSMHWIAKQMNVAAFVQAADDLFYRHGVELHLIGEAPMRLKERVSYKSLKATVFRGYVDDLRTELAQARAGLVVEETGGGFKLKVLDYVFCRLPVFALKGSFTGVPTPLASTFFTADTLSGLATTVVDRITDLPELNARQQEAFDAARHSFDWDANGRDLIERALGVRTPEPLRQSPVEPGARMLQGPF